MVGGLRGYMEVKGESGQGIGKGWQNLNTISGKDWREWFSGLVFCVIFSNIFSLGNPQYFYCISKSLGWQSLCNPWDEMFATFNEEIYETCGAEMLV